MGGARGVSSSTQCAAHTKQMVLYSNSLRTFCRLHNGNVSKAILDLQCLLTSSASSSSISPLNKFQKEEEEEEKKLEENSESSTVSENFQNSAILEI